MTPTRRFLDESRAFLTREYMPRIEHCLDALTDEQIWHRSNGASNSIGNLMLHLSGSSRYWATEVIGREPIGRVRQREFDERGPVPRERLMDGLRASVEEVDRRLANLPESALLETRKHHDEESTVLWCVYHIVEHFSYHTGQILSMTKAMVGEIAALRE